MVVGAKTDRSFCTFRLDDHLFGVDMLDVKEVTTETSYTTIAHAPDEVLGLVNIRGHIYLTLDLRRLLGLTASQLTNDSRIVLFKSGVGHSFGVVVDAIDEIHSAAPDQIEAFSTIDHDALASKLKRVDLISAICKLPNELLVVLNPRRFLTVVEQGMSISA